MIIGKRDFDFSSHHVYVMGILNITPDSFSDGGKYTEKDAILKHTEEMIDSGADIIDVGGESTRPGHIQISVQEEIDRVTEVIRQIKDSFDIPVSIDTYKAEVAACALQAGADVINDIWGLKYDRQMADVIADAKLPCVLMHNRKEAVYGNFLADCLNDLKETLDIASRAGIKKDKIILDPGVGFAKSYEQNLIVLRHLKDFNKLNLPLLLGTSRKSVIGLTLKEPVTERLEGTLTTTVLAVLAGWSFVRVHDVKANVRAIKMTKAILEAEE